MFLKKCGGLLLKEGDFVKLEYEGYDEDGKIFDSTKGEIAKTLRGKEGPIVMILGKDKMIQGLQDAIFKMKKGEENEITLDPKDAFGVRKKELVKVLPESEFRKQNLDPQPGLQIQMDTSFGRLMGIIKSITSGRVMVDFNHPLAGKKVRYKIKLVDVLTELKDKVSSVIDRMGFDADFELKNENLTLKIKKDKDYEQKKNMLVSMIKVFIPEIKEIKAE